MSKSPNLLLPVLGGIGLVLGAGYGIATRNYKTAELASAAAQAATVTARADAAEAARADLAARAAAAEAEAADLRARPVSASLTAPAPERDGTFGLGRAALPEEVAAWDVDVLPDGRGLPPGKGDVWTGEEVFADACASCHGDFAEGVDNWPVLAGGFDTLADEDPVKTVGSYWPYLSTVWDYVNRSMPFGAAQTLEADEVYAITAYILYSNDLVDDDFELSHENFADFTMHNEGGFVIDDRPEMEYAAWRAEPCMENCKDAATVTMRSVFLVEEPAEGGTNSVMNHDRGALDAVPQFTAQGPSFVTEAAAGAPKPAPVAPVQEAAVSGDDALIKAGEGVFRRCKSCHQIGSGAKNRSGPILTGVMGRQMAAVDGFKYSDAFVAAGAEGRAWDTEAMTAFMQRPKAYMAGTKMAFGGLKDAGDIEALIAYLSSFDG